MYKIDWWKCIVTVGGGQKRFYSFTARYDSLQEAEKAISSVWKKQADLVYSKDYFYPSLNSPYKVKARY